MSVQQREQWEALIIEPSVWRRAREVSGTDKGVVFDVEDQENIDVDLQNEFRRLSNNIDPTRLHVVDHPLARFYRLMYTDEFEDFRRNVLRESVTGRGVVEMSRGVREMLTDQVFRYFVFVEENPVEAIRFGQLIVAIAVFRNTYDDDARKFIEGGVLKSRRRLYKTTTAAISRRDIEETEFVDLSSYGIPAKYETPIATAVVNSIQSGSDIIDILPLGQFGRFQTDDISFTSPLKVHTSVFSPVRKLALHFMHLLSNLGTEQAMADGIKIVYIGTAPPEALLLTRGILPSTVALSQGIENITSDNYTLVVLDEENDLEATAGVGDDSRLMKQISTTIAIKNNFRQHPERLLGVSMFIRPPSVLSGKGSFEFIPGDVYQTAWKNPQDERMRLVWTPDRFSTEMINYSLRSYISARKFQDYVVRPLYKFNAINLPDALRPYGLVEGEFDSELEKYIVGAFYNKYPAGRKTWSEAVDTETDILVAPRFIDDEPYVFKKVFLDNYHSSVVRLHLDTPNNPILQHVARVMRAGLFPTANLGRTPLVEALEVVFGTGSRELAAQTVETFRKIEEDRRNVIMTLKEKNIFPRETDKTIMITLLKDLTKNFRELALFEPSIRRRQDDYMYPLVTELERGDAVNIVQLGDSLGNLMYDVYMELDNLRIRVENVFFEGTFPFNQLWKYITRDEPPTFVRVNSVYELKDPLEKSSLPFILVRGFGYPKEIFDAFVNAWSGSRGFRGFVEMGKEGTIVSNPSQTLSRPKEKFDQLVAGKLQDMVAGRGKSCLFIGSDHESSLNFLSLGVITRVFHLVESASGARRVTEMSSIARRKILSRVFVRENMTRNFVLPVEDDRYDYICCNPVVFTRLTKDTASATKFFSEIGKAMRHDSVFRVVVLNDLMQYVEEHGQGSEGYGKNMSNGFFDAEVFNESFELNGAQGFKIDLQTLRKICTHAGFETRYVSDNYSGMETYDREDMEEEVEDEIVRSSSPSREVMRGRGEPGGLIGSRLKQLLPIVEFIKERGGATRNVNVEERAFEAYEGQAVDVGVKVRQYNNLVKRSMIGQVRKPQRVLDLACGHGQDMNKWFSDETVETYVGMDASESAIEEAERRLKSRKGYKPRNAKFISRDLFESQEWVFDAQTNSQRGTYNVISCQLALHYAFSSEKTVKRFLYNVSTLLEMGGDFIVSTIDDRTIRSVVNAHAGKRPGNLDIRGEHYILEVDQEAVELLINEETLPAGVSYRFTQFPSDPMSRTTTEFVVDHGYLQTLAGEMGLLLTSSANFLQDDVNGEDMSASRDELSTDDKEIVAFYRTYKFKKVAEPRNVQASIASAFKFTESAQQFLSVFRLVEAVVAENILAFKRGLFVSPEHGFPGPYVKDGYECLHVFTDNINSVRNIATQLKRQGRLGEKETILISSPKESELYDTVFLPYSVSSNPEMYIDRLPVGGCIYGIFVTIDKVNELIESGDSTFSNSIFDLTVSRRRSMFSINEPLDAVSHKLTNLDHVTEVASREGMRIDIVKNLQTPPTLNAAGKDYLGLFGLYKLTKVPGSSAAPMGKTVEEMPILPRPAQEIRAPVEEGLAEVDKFVLLPGLVQKKAPGRGKDETLRTPGDGGAYRDLARDPRWRFKLSDEWESEEFMIRMPSGETFTSVRNAMIYYKCVFAGEENEGYRGLNRSTGLPQPEDLKPYTKAIRGKMGSRWKEEESRILRSVYEAKYTNTPNVSNDNPENLSPLRALLLTKNAHLFSNSKTRNELLEMIRQVLQRIVVA